MFDTEQRISDRHGDTEGLVQGISQPRAALNAGFKSRDSGHAINTASSAAPTVASGGAEMTACYQDARGFRCADYMAACKEGISAQVAGRSRCPANSPASREADGRTLFLPPHSTRNCVFPNPLYLAP